MSAKSYTYYPTGAIKSVTEDGTTTTYTYDERGNVLTETTGTTVNTYTYDHCNNRISHTLTVGGAVISAESYAYDQRCRMISVTGAQGITLYGYNLNNARTSEYTLTADGASVILSTGYTYAAPGLVSVCRSVNRNSETLVYLEYTYYGDGNLRTETDYVKNQITSYTYDNAGRLETEISPAGSYSYTYDAAGNRATMTENGTTTTYTYDKNNRLLTESKPGSIITYTYDANGNLLSGDGATYTYDARNRQVGYVKGSDFATYTYYPSGLRKTKTTALAISNYIWDGSNMICEYASSATSGKVYIYGHTLISQGNSWYYLYNAHGDVVKYINANGAVLKSYDYDAFGEEADPSATDTNPFRYAGQYFDDETGTYYLRARYYDPGNGRFSQEDPIRSGLNWYAYCGNNPVMYVDPSGLVEVGLRAYAATYEGSIVSWDDENKTATVTWNDKTITVKSTAENNRDGRIYVDDSLFINSFGVGSKVIVYQDEVTKNISIRAGFNYRGLTAYTRSENFATEDAPFGLSYSTAFLMGIEEYWSGTFGEYNVSTYARYYGEGINTVFNSTLGISHMSHPLFGWSKKRVGKIVMFAGDSRSTHTYSFADYKWVAAHEFGHILGVGDAYDSSKSTHITSIFNTFGTSVQENDIHCVIEAWKNNRFYRFP